MTRRVSAPRRRTWSATSTNHAADFDTACFTVAGYSSESEADGRRRRRWRRAPRSPPWRRPRPVARSAGLRHPLRRRRQLPAGTNLDTSPLNTVSSPIADDGNYLLIEITKRTPTHIRHGPDRVEGAVQNAGAAKARTTINAAEKRADVSVDRRYGRWVPAAQSPRRRSPATGDLLNPSVERRRHVHGDVAPRPGSPPSRWGGTVPASPWWAWGPPARSS